MTFGQVCRLVLRRWPLVVAMTLVWVVVAAVVVRLQPPIYQASATVQITSHDSTFLAQVDQVVQAYAEAAKARDTLALARVDAGGPLSDVAVRTFLGSPILKIDATDADSAAAERTATSVTRALLSRAASGEVGISGLNLLVVDRPSLQAEPIAPKPALTLVVAALVGLGLGIGAAMLGESLGGSGSGGAVEQAPKRRPGSAASMGAIAVDGLRGESVRPRTARAARPSGSADTIATATETRRAGR